MIPAIAKVGEKYERKEYFLPQLLLCAETMQTGFDSIKHLLVRDGEQARDTIVMATVEGDIHDIGKNIVCLMLRNFGYNVVDLGKDVPAADIVAAAVEHGASVIGLSALMTTTMVRMEDTVRLVREQGLPCRVMVGGAVVTQSYADLIGAHGYSDDAVAAVRTATRLCAEVRQG
jgi:5-methyltetrahydrofolate--homocysteine methyltransferase